MLAFEADNIIWLYYLFSSVIVHGRLANVKRLKSYANMFTFVRSVYSDVYVFSTSSVLAECDSGWVALEGHCYKLIPYPSELNGSILESRWQCLQIGADIATMKTEREQLFMKEILGTVKVCLYHFLAIDTL